MRLGRFDVNGDCCGTEVRVPIINNNTRVPLHLRVTIISYYNTRRLRKYQCFDEAIILFVRKITNYHTRASSRKLVTPTGGYWVV